MTKKSTKRRLLASALTLVICIAMLVGTTFAWFTDSVTSAGNKIQSGTLKLDLELLDKETNSWSSIKTNQKPIFDYDLWEPGYTEVKILKVENEGSLALKWYAKFVSATELGILADVIDVYVKAYGVLEDASVVTYPSDRNLEGYTKVGTVRDFVNTIETTTYGSLLAGEKAYLGLALKMQETAGNEYQDKTLGAFDIQILATQETYEKDSFDEMYDDDADRNSNISVVNADEMQAAFDDAKDGDVITLSGDLNVGDGIEFDSDADVTLDLGGYSLEGNTDVLLDVAAGSVVIQNGSIINTKSGATETQVSVRLSGDAVAEIKEVDIETTGIGVLLEDDAKITELNANIKSYVDANGNCEGTAIALRSGSARIDLISGGEYTSTYSDEFIDAYSGSFSGTAMYPISVNSAQASIGEISGGTFLGRADDGRNGATIYVNAGKIEKISGGYFGFCKYTMRNNPYFLITVNTANGASIDAITGGTFEYAGGFGCDFENIVAQSGSIISKRAEKATVTVKFSSSTKTKDVEIWDVVSQ